MNAGVSRAALWLLAVLGLLLASVAPAAAHLDFVSSNPKDGQVVDGEVRSVRLNFSIPAEPAGSGFRLIAGTGDEISAEAVSKNSGETWVITPNSPLSEGQYGVKWRVTAPDTHPKSGNVRFSVSGASGAATSAEPPPASDALDQALAEPDTTTAEIVRWAGSTAAILGIMLALGGLIFLGFVMTGRPAEISRIRAIIRWSGVLVVLGTMVQIIGRSVLLQEGDWGAALNPAGLSEVLALPGFAGFALVRLVGGVLLVVGVSAATRPDRYLSLTESTGPSNESGVRANLLRSPVAVVGAALCAVSFLLDGHTATVEPLLLVWLSDLAHVIAAASWVGGLTMLAVVLGQRRAAGQSLDPAYLVVKYSVVAAAGLAVAGLAGVALTVEILDYPAQLWESSWGQILIAKVLLVSVVAAFGAYNHFRLLPVLERTLADEDSQVSLTNPASPTAPANPSGSAGATDVMVSQESASPAVAEAIGRKLRTTAWVELGLLLIVVGLTAALISSSPGT
jgi:copper transport protein